MGNCNTCGSENTLGMSRVVGYYSIIENWNGSKQAELKDRQKGTYKFGEVPQKMEQACILVA
jgi:anaerobic ribonucleoside-triphosphate reductase